MRFTSITSMSWYIFILPKINLWTAWWSACLPGVFIQEFFKFHSIYYLSIEKDFSEVRNTSNFFTYGFRIYQLCAEWWCLVSVSNWSIVIFTFTCYYYMKQLFQKSKYLILIYLWALRPIEIWLFLFFYPKNYLYSDWWCLLQVPYQTL